MGQNFMKKFEKELLSCYHICPSIYDILLSMGTPFYTHELSNIISENVSKHQIQ